MQCAAAFYSVSSEYIKILHGGRGGVGEIFQDPQFLSVAICASDLFANATFLYFMYLSDNDVSMMAIRGIAEMAL